MKAEANVNVKRTERTIRPQWPGYEIRRLGWSGVSMPVLVLFMFAALAALGVIYGGGDRQAARILVAGVEVGVPMAAGLVAAGVTSTDPALGLQLSLWTRYRTTVLRRLGILVAWAGFVSFLWTSALWITGVWNLWVPGDFLAGQLTWVPPLLWFVALGSLLALVLRSTAASGAILGGIWVFENMFAGYFLSREWLRPFYLFATTRAPGADYWLGNRLALISTSLVVAFLVVWMLKNTEALSKGDDT